MPQPAAARCPLPAARCPRALSSHAPARLAPDPSQTRRAAAAAAAAPPRGPQPARPDVMVFSDFSLRVPAGKTVALVGSSGAGRVRGRGGRASPARPCPRCPPGGPRHSPLAPGPLAGGPRPRVPGTLLHPMPRIPRPASPAPLSPTLPTLPLLLPHPAHTIDPQSRIRQVHRGGPGGAVLRPGGGGRHARRRRPAAAEPLMAARPGALRRGRAGGTQLQQGGARGEGAQLLNYTSPSQQRYPCALAHAHTRSRARARARAHTHTHTHTHAHAHAHAHTRTSRSPLSALQVGLVSQEPTLFMASIKDNIALGRPGAAG
jgi:hypothetical protein